MSVCYENRNGNMMVYDTAAKTFLARGEWEDIEGDQPEWREFTATGLGRLRHLDAMEPGAIREELGRRGVAEVLVYTGPVPSWVNGQVLWPNIPHKFAAMASQASPFGKSWTVVPVSRIDDGSDWEDIYGS